MSKYLIKILAICAFVMLLPLAAVATTLAVVSTREFTLKVDIVGDTNTNASANVLINGQDVDKISVVYGTTVVLSFENVGYDFVGWFEGTAYTYDPESDPVSEQTRFSLKVTDNMDLTAVCISKQYTVNYTGFKEDGTTPISESVDNYKYGDELITPSKANADSIQDFLGWKMIGSTELYKQATFPESGVVEVVAVWSGTKTVSYYNADGDVISSKYYNSETITDLSLMDLAEAQQYASEGYHVVGYKHRESGVEIDEAELERIKNNFDTTALDIQLVEEINEYALTFKGLVEADKEDVAYNGTYEFGQALPTTERTGFKGWKIEGDETDTTFVAANFATYPHDSDITLVAVWEGKTIVYNYNNGQASDSSTYTKAEFDKLTALAEPNSNKITAGYHAEGWLRDNVEFSDLSSLQKENYSSDILVLTINEVINSYNLTFEGLEEATNGTFTYGQALPTTERTGFKGWKIEGDETDTTFVAANFATYPHDSDITLVAVWEGKTIVYNYNNGQASDSSTYTKAEFDKLTALAEPNSNKITAGYHAEGWLRDNVEFSDLSSLQKENYSSDILVLTINEVINSYNLTFEGLEEATNGTFTYGQALPTTERAGFNGWKINGEGEIVKVANFATYPHNSDITLVADWSSKEVTFEYSDGHKVSKPYTKAQFDALTMDDFTTDETHISEGYHAAGWKVGENVLTAESLKEMQGAKYESTAITLVVYEEKDEYTVKYSGFKEDGTTPIDQTATLKYGDELMKPEKASAESRAEFVGWKIEGDQSETTYLTADFAAYENGAQITLIAVWEEKPETAYTLNMEGFIGNAADSITIKASDYSALSNWKPGDRSYYTFKGFNYNGTSYNNENYQALVEAIVAAGATEVTLTTEWTCEITHANFDVWHIIGGDYNEVEDAIFFFNTGATITSMETTLLEAFFGTTDGSTTVTVKGQSYTVSNIVIYYDNTADAKVSVADNGIGSYTFADLAGFVDGKEGYDAKEVFESPEGLRIEFTLQAK